MKTLLKVLLGFALFVVCAIGAVFYFTRGLVDTADAFFDAVKRQDLVAARGYLADAFKASTDESALREFLTHSALADYKQASWSNRRISTAGGSLGGTVVTANGGSVPLELSFVREQDAWRIYSIQSAPAGLIRRVGSVALPDRAEQRQMAKTALRDFAASVREHSMQRFRSTTSQIWQKQFTLEKFDSAYETAFKNAPMFAGVENVEPTIVYADEPGEHGELLLSGNAAAESDVVYFDAKYVYEGAAWKLIGFHFKI